MWYKIYVCHLNHNLPNKNLITFKCVYMYMNKCIYVQESLMNLLIIPPASVAGGI